MSLYKPVACLDEIEQLQELAGTAYDACAAVVETPHHLEVLEAREDLVDGCVLTGEPDAFAHTCCIAHDVETHDVCTAAVGANQRGQDPDGRRLVGAVRAEQTEDASCSARRSRHLGRPRPRTSCAVLCLDSRLGGHVTSNRGDSGASYRG